MDGVQIPVETDEARAHLEREWGSWQARTTAQVLDHVADRVPDRPFIITDDRVLTYAEAAAYSIRLAAGLQAAGVRSGDHVAVIMANFAETILLKFAVARLGAVSVSINFLLRGDDLRYVLRQSRSKLLISMDQFRGLDYLRELDALAPGWDAPPPQELPDLERVFVFPTGEGTRPVPASLDDLIELGADVSDEQVLELTARADPQSTSDLLYTSGTTGRSKGVMLHHDAVVRTGYSSAYTRALWDGYRILHALPIHHVFGYIEATLGALFVGGSVVPHTVFDAHSMLTAVEHHQPDEIMCVPAMTVALLQQEAKKDYDLSSLSTLFSSGAAHVPEMWTQMIERFGVSRLFTAYGQTETTASTMCTQPGDPLDRLRGTNGTTKPAGLAGDPTLGGALAVYKAVNPLTGEEVPKGQIGELLARGPIMTRGYFDEPEQTEALFTKDGWLRTGDLGRIDADGYLTLTGRQKESYRFGGELVQPGDVERVLLEHPGVAEAYVMGVPHTRFGEVGCACVVPAAGHTLDEAELIEFCRDRLARFKVPARVLFMRSEDFPRTVTGKVQKFRMADRVAALVER
ncbi:AMP-binding protein [Streptomyces sp. NPDC005336]|uniref:class I adenylate-forming enzyme family protein n=1 Tax=Streptomyces sp. NPDC005336 TaxID=3157035 RepID=UPI0033A2A427